MISKQDLINMAHRVTKRSQGYKQKKFIHPKRDWFIGIGLFGVILAGGAFLNAKEHIHINNLDSNINVETTEFKNYKDKTAEMAQTIYTKRQIEFDSLVKTLPVVPVFTPAATSSGETATSTSTVADETTTAPEEAAAETPSVTDEETEAEPSSPPVLVE